MFNFLNKAVSLFHTKPSVSYLQPKAINVYFKNAINPKYILLNINRYDYVELEIISAQLNNNNVFILAANLHGEVDSQLSLGTFETRIEADTALLILRNKLFGLDKKIVKFTALFLILTILVGLFGNALDGLLKKMPTSNMSLPIAQNSMPATTNSNFILPTTLTAQDKSAMPKGKPVDFTGQVLANQNQAQAVQAVQPTAPAPEPAPEVSSNPEVNSLINNLGK